MIKNQSKYSDKNQGVYISQQSIKYLNIYLTLLLELISQIKHTINPNFITLFISIIRIKIAVCLSIDCTRCFCCGCLLARRYTALFKKNTSWFQKIIQQYKNYQLELKIPLNENILKVEKKKNIKQLFLEQIQSLEQIYNKKKFDWEKDYQLIRFLSVIHIVVNILVFIQFDHNQVLQIINSIKNTGQNRQDIQKMFNDVKNLCQVKQIEIKNNQVNIKSKKK